MPITTWPPSLPPPAEGGLQGRVELVTHLDSTRRTSRRATGNRRPRKKRQRNKRKSYGKDSPKAGAADFGTYLIELYLNAYFVDFFFRIVWRKSLRWWCSLSPFTFRVYSRRTSPGPPRSYSASSTSTKTPRTPKLRLRRPNYVLLKRRPCAAVTPMNTEAEGCPCRKPPPPSPAVVVTPCAGSSFIRQYAWSPKRLHWQFVKLDALEEFHFVLCGRDKRKHYTFISLI